MIIKGRSVKNGQFFASHLMNTEKNERVEIKEMRGLYADDVKEAFREMRLLAAGTRAENPYYHASLSPDPDEPALTSDQWEYAVDSLERNLGLDDHARFVVEHEKNGRTHRHVVWSRVDVDTMTVASDSFNYLAHNRTREELEQAFGHEPTPPPQERGTRIRDWEYFRAQESGIDPKELKAEVTELWRTSDSGRAFQAALDNAGYVLCKGDRRDFCLVDQAGDVHSLARRVDGAKSADIRARLTDIDRDSLMTVQQATAWVKEQTAEAGSLRTDEPVQETGDCEELAHTLNPKLRILEKLAQEPPKTSEVATSAEHLAQMREEAMRSLTDGQSSHESGRHAWETLRTRAAEASQGIEDKSGEFWRELVDKTEKRDNPHDEPELER